MRLVAVKLRNFRAYVDEVTIPITRLTAFVGRNDVGKSSVFDALGIFFGEASCKLDVGDRSVFAKADEDMSITCLFADLPKKLVLDQASETSLADEYLLNGDGLLEVRKRYVPGSLKEVVEIIAVHPTAEHSADLLSKKNAELKKIAKGLGVDSGDDRSNVALRQAIREASDDLVLAQLSLPIAKEGAKEIWTQIERCLPHYALFRADRASTDGDAEVQDPMTIAIRAALGSLKVDLDAIEAKVRDSALDVAARTIGKLAEINPNLAKTLQPRFKEPKWESVFKLSLTGDHDIPLNKRGSGVRRLILFAFFRAEVERIRTEKGTQHVLYAIEEPETSQHPTNQVAVVETLKELAETDGCQVLLTTHVPALAGQLPAMSLRHITTSTALVRQIDSGDGILKAIADDLGVFADYQDNRVKVFFCLEGPTDIELLKRFSATLSAVDPQVLDLGKETRVAMLPLGGATLKDWVTRNYLKELGKPEIHLYDRDKPEYAVFCDEVNARGNGSWGAQTQKLEIENYLHKDAIRDVLGIDVQITDDDDVMELIKAAGPGVRRDGRSLKRWLSEDVAAAMTADMIDERGGEEVRGWLQIVKDRLN